MLGVINLDPELDNLNELTYFRCGAAAPFGGRYRLIDFVLSNMVNSNINDIAVFARRKYRSLMDHLGTGAAWDLDRKRGGLFILPPDWNDPTDISKGDLQHFHNNRDFFERGTAQYVLVTGSQYVCNIDYSKALQFHIQNNADITLIYKHVKELSIEHKLCHKVEIDANSHIYRVTNDHFNHQVYMGMFIINKKLLIELVDHCIAHGMDNFFRDAIAANTNKLKIYGYKYDGYLSVINSIESYYRHSMSLLSPEVYRELFFSDQLIYTKIKDEPPAKYIKGSTVRNSLIANGCVIEGHVENCILFRGVHVAKGAVVKNSIIMQRSVINENAMIENVILDKDTLLSSERKFIGGIEQPFVVAKRKVM